MRRIDASKACPCASGHNHADCCQPLAEAARAAHDLDRETFEALRRFVATLPDDPMKAGIARYQTAGEVDEDRMGFIIPWIVHHATSVRDQFLADDAAPSERGRAWLEAQRGAWVSVWEVTSVTPGLSVRLLDRLTGAERTVFEEAGSEQLLPRTTLLARVVDFDGVSVLCGVHPVPLMVWGAERVVEEAHDRLGDATAEQLRDGDATHALIKLWEDEASESLERPLPQFFNTEGDELVIVSQRWKHDDRNAVLERLRALPDVEVEEDALSLTLNFVDPTQEGDASDDPDDPFALLNRLGRTVAFATLGNHRLELTTDSRERATRIAKEIEQSCGDLLKPMRRQVSTVEELHKH